MKITKDKKFFLLKPVDTSLELFLKNIENEYPNFKGEHLILDFSEIINTKIEELLLFLNVSSSHKDNGTSFVIICEGIDIDKIPDELSVVPTFKEALDILEMDAIERELGF